MKLQKQLSRKVGDKVYPKWVLVLPPDIVEKAGLKEGVDIEAEIKNGRIVLKKK